MTRIVQRASAVRAEQRLIDAGTHPLLARLYATRGVGHAQEIDYRLQAMLPPTALRGATEAASLLADAIEAGARIVIIADYDCDGATACAVGVRALRQFGADVHYLVPNRATDGYGLTPDIVMQAARMAPDVLVTVDNGIASVEGVAAARAAGMATVITDHHLPGDVLPEADVIVNPNQPGCDFPSKALAGVGVMFYVMLALRAELRERGAFANRNEPNLANLLDLVALGTIADVVPLDHNNRLLVTQGLARVRSGRMQPGLQALFTVSGREPARANSFDFGFALGPRINAAGRLADMSLGIEALITDDIARALNIAQELDRLNRARRSIEDDMQEAALARLDDYDAGSRASVALFEPDWHQGVIGIVAGRIKNRLHRPVIAFARGNDGELKGSGRSVASVHLRDALDLVSKRAPDLLLRFGGHAMAAGLTIRESDFAQFCDVFEDVLLSLVDPAALTHTLESDGPLAHAWLNIDTARQLETLVWGQGFAPPLFDDQFSVAQQRLLKDRHLRLQLDKDGSRYDAIHFNCADALPARVHAAYRIETNTWNNATRLQLNVEYCAPL